MGKKSDAIHSNHLERIINNISLIGEKHSKIEWIMKEGIWMASDGNRILMPDFIIKYKTNSFLIGELKKSIGGREKAIRQIASGENFVSTYFTPDYIKRKIVYYKGGNYTYEVI